MTKPFFSFIIIVISFGFAFFYVRPEYSLVGERRADLDTLMVTSKSSNMIKTLINETEKNLNSVNSVDLARFDIFLPEVIDPIRFANNLQHIGITNGLVLENIKVEEPARNTQDSAGLSAGNQPSPITQPQGAVLEKKYATTKTNFTFTATYEKFHIFLNDIEKSLGLINITTLSFQPVVETPDPKKIKSVGLQIYQFTVAVETYSLK